MSGRADRENRRRSLAADGVCGEHGKWPFFRKFALVVATGGLAIPKIGATPFGYRLAEQFGLPVVSPKPALVPLALGAELLEPLKPMAGNTLDAVASAGDASFRENVLLTHRGLSGPAILQVSSYWQMQAYDGGRQQPVAIDLLPGIDAAAWLNEHRQGRVHLPNLSEHFVRDVHRVYVREDGTRYLSGGSGGAYGHKECLIRHFGQAVDTATLVRDGNVYLAPATAVV